MSPSIRRVITSFSFATSALPAVSIPFGETDYGSLSMNRLFARQSNLEYDPEDLSYITRMAAVGDSYSAGIGAGDRLGSVLEAFFPGSDYACSRYDSAYPYLVHTDGRLGDTEKRNFQFKSCSGAVMKDIHDKQILQLDGSQDVIMLSAGGNDAELSHILNQCIFQWGTITKEQAILAKIEVLRAELAWGEKIDWDAAARGCDGQLKYSEDIINSDEFSTNMDNLLKAAKLRLKSGFVVPFLFKSTLECLLTHTRGKIYWTGYAKFFGEEMTSECDKVSWATWIYKLQRAGLFFQPEAFLTKQHRKTMNRLVDLVNRKIAAAAKRAGPQVEFVDYDRYVGDTEGRFCEPGVDEGSDTSGSRAGLMFYEMNGLDPFGTNPWKRSEDPLTNGTIEMDQNVMAELTRYLDHDVELAGEGRVNAASHATSAAPKEGPVDFNTKALLEIPRLLPDGYGRVFHPQILLHQVIANLVIHHMIDENDRRNGQVEGEELLEIDISSCPYVPPSTDKNVLKYGHSKPGKAAKPGTELRILCAGDSITVGYLSDRNGGDGNGYRLQMRNDLSKDKVVYAGTVSSGTMKDAYYAAWSGKTIQYIADHIGPSLKHQPNIILLHAGTNDMNPSTDIATEGNDPAGAADRLGKLIDQMIKECPDAVILVAMIVNTCDPNQSGRTKEYQKLVPSVVKARRNRGHHVLAADFTSFPVDSLQDCIHPTNDGYRLFGDYWYDFITQIPKEWIKDPVGSGPERTKDINSNGGLDGNIPAPDWGTSPIQPIERHKLYQALLDAGSAGRKVCKTTPHWYGGGQIALGGVGHNGDWQYHKDWVEAGEVASGLKRDPRHVRLQDMNGDGKADYVWLDPDTGMIICWINNLPDPWSPAGTNDSVIGSGAGRAESIFLADMNGDGMDDYMVVNPDNGAVRIWWNYGPDKQWVNGWKFVEGGEIASGVPHANWETLRFPDINGDGRADYVYIGEGGALKHHMNTGSDGGEDVLFIAMGGIATGASSDISAIAFADMDGDGRDDYLIWDDVGGLTGFLNQPTNREGVPLYINQGPAKTIADGISQNPSALRLADLDGDGKDDYAYIDQNGALFLWWNRGTADTSMTIDGLRFADIDGDGRDDYVWLDAATGAPKVFINDGNARDSLGWLWRPLNDGKPIASGAAPAAHVQFGDIDGDGKADYLVLDPVTGALDAYLNKGADPDFVNGWRWEPIGQMATGLGPGANVRIADIDGDGRADYVYLHPGGGATTTYRNVFGPDTPADAYYRALPGMDATGVGHRPAEIAFADLDGDGKADYVWTNPADGRARAWRNDYPNLPAWQPLGEIAGGVGTAGSNIRWAKLDRTGRASYVAADPGNGALAVWLNGCDDVGGPPPNYDPGSAPTPCATSDACRDFACPEGKTPRCSVLGGPVAGQCICSEQASRVLGAGHRNSSMAQGTRQNATAILHGFQRNSSLILNRHLS